MNADHHRCNQKISAHLRLSASNYQVVSQLLVGVLCSFLAAAAAGDVISLAPRGEALVLDATRTSPFASLWGRETPQIRSVQLRPERPRAARPVEVTVEAFSDRTDTDLPEVVEVLLLYSTDIGRSWKQVALERPRREPRLWRGRIPAQPRAARVLFYVRARDNFGNIASELPLRNEAFPPDPARMFPLAQDPHDADELVPADIDLLGTRVGYDAEHLYVRQSVRGNLSGLLAPHLYTIAVMNPDDPQVESFTDAPALAYIPLGALARLPTSGLLRVERLFRSPQEAQVPGAEVKFEVDTSGGRQAMLFRFRRAALGANPSGWLNLVGITMTFPDLKRPAAVPWEASPFSTVYFRAHEYVVE